MDENAAAIAATTAAAAATAAANGELYATGAVPWTTPPADLSMAQFADSAMAAGSLPMHSASAQGQFSMASVTSSAASTGVQWMDPSVMDIFQYGPGQSIHSYGPPFVSPQQQQQQMHTPGSIASSSANNYFPSPSTTPSLRQSPAAGHDSVPLSSGGSSSSSLYYQNHFSHQHSALQSQSHGSYHGNAHLATCVCFTACLHALQALHNASTPATPPFDVVLSLNRNAVEGCAVMLACSRCMSCSGTHTTAMLLATLLGKITSFYKTASQFYFRGDAESVAPLRNGSGCGGGGGPANVEKSRAGSPGRASGANTTGPVTTAPTVHITISSASAIGAEPSGPSSSIVSAGGNVAGLGVSLGAYQLQGEDRRWLELEILHRELKKLEDVYARFREVCGDLLFEDVAVSKAMLGYLGQTLGATLDMVNHCKGDLQFL
ncbi:hypothetical protein SCUCBS95973_008083 [Sporothrix curviconia]|uniref:Transcription factor n=1 Tax=Sporothrix curviconia TaxID=1260050 RepID=A0ABP0CII0_9PEZI